MQSPTAPALKGAGSARQRQAASEDDLITGHIALARGLARRFANRGETLDDLVQVAMVGLIKAARRYDADHQTQFSTYATATITGELKRHFRDKRWGLHVTRSSQERYLLVRDATEWATSDLGRAPTVAEIASYARVTEEEVLEAQELASVFHLDSIDAPSPNAERAGDGMQLGGLDTALAGVDDRLVLHDMLQTLSERERTILRLRFVDELTQSEIAARLALSQMQVSRILARTLASLRTSLAR